MRVYLYRLSLATPGASWILLLSQRFLLLGVDRDRWLSNPLLFLNSPVDMPKLSVAIWMTEPCTRLAIGLQTIAGFVEKLTDQGRTNRMTLLGQLTGQEACTLARPPQWRFRISAAFWINQTLQRKAEFGIYLFS